jgi:hypothetical protein
MSSTISSTSSQNTLSSALLALTNQTSPNSANANGGGVDATAGIDLDTLQLSGSSLSDLESTAQTVAAQNQNSVITTSEAALAANLAAVSAMFSDPTTTQSSQATQDPSQVLSLTS